MNILTLSMAEKTNRNDYQIIGLDLDSQEIVSISGISKDDIIVNNNSVWDIGAVTSIDLTKNDSEGVYAYNYSGKAKLKEPFDRNFFLKVLKMKSHGNSKFFVNEKEIFDIIRIVRLDDIIERGGKHYIRAIIAADTNHTSMRISADGIREQSGKYYYTELLVKDIRWVKYWDWAKKNKFYEEKVNIYRKSFNKFYHDKYIVVYRHRFNNLSTSYWVTGLHLM